MKDTHLRIISLRVEKKPWKLIQLLMVNMQSLIAWSLETQVFNKWTEEEELARETENKWTDS